MIDEISQLGATCRDNRGNRSSSYWMFAERGGNDQNTITRHTANGGQREFTESSSRNFQNFPSKNRDNIIPYFTWRFANDKEQFYINHRDSINIEKKCSFLDPPPPKKMS